MPKTIPFLQNRENDITNIITLVEESIQSLDDVQLNQKASAEKWSAAECLEHLNIYSNYYQREMKKAILGAIRSGSKPVEEFAFSFLGKKSMEAVNPANRKKAKTLKRMNPAFSEVETAVVDRFIEYQRELKDMVRSVHSLNLQKIKISIEFFPLLKMNLADCIQFMVFHEQRHLMQALEALDLPPSNKLI